jgi:hypothetical protein
VAEGVPAGTFGDFCFLGRWPHKRPKGYWLREATPTYPLAGKYPVRGLAVDAGFVPSRQLLHCQSVERDRLTGDFGFALTHPRVNHRAADLHLQLLPVDVRPFQPKHLADAQTCRRTDDPHRTKLLWQLGHERPKLVRFQSFRNPVAGPAGYLRPRASREDLDAKWERQSARRDVAGRAGSNTRVHWRGYGRGATGRSRCTRISYFDEAFVEMSRTLAENLKKSLMNRPEVKLTVEQGGQPQPRVLL